MPTYALPGETKEERVKYVQWILGKNHHIKTVKEVFKKGNNWIEVDFDCEFSRDMAMNRIREKEGDWLKLIPEEINRQSKNIDQQLKDDNKKKAKKVEKPIELKITKETEDISTAENSKNQHNFWMIWDLSANINTEEVKHICKSIQKA
jgi:hypothetical protein